MNAPLGLLTLCQGLLLVNNVTFIAINGLVGLALAPVAWMATLPVTGYVAGGALATGLVARHQRRWGRQRTFPLGLPVDPDAIPGQQRHHHSENDHGAKNDGICFSHGLSG